MSLVAIGFRRVMARAVVSRHLPSLARQFSYTGGSATGYTSPIQELFDELERNIDLTPFGPGEHAQPEERYLKCGIPESALRFTTRFYGRLLLAPHVHPGEHRVTMRVNSSDLNLTDLEREILREIVGNRLCDRELKLSSNQFGSRIENKRHLVSMLDRIILSCKRLAKEIQEQ